MAGGRRSGFGRRGGAGALRAPGPGLFRDVLLAPDRDKELARRPVVSWRRDDDAGFLRELERRALSRVVLRRRGREHGGWAELDPAGLLPPRARRRRREALARERWHAARPLLLPEAAVGPVAALSGSYGLGELRARLASPDGLLAWLEESASTLAPRFRVRGPATRLEDPERDLARVGLAAEGAGDLWVKAARLSTHAADASLRLRVSSGREGADDASRDEVRHALVAELGRRLLPGAAQVDRLAGVREPLEAWLGGPVVFTQQIAYWNAPQGGARFHHDAFHESDEGGQRGVLYVQLVGRTAWIALSIEDLAARVRELVGSLDEPERDWLEEEVFGGAALAALTPVLEDRASLLRELGRPGCGRLGPLVDRGPEFTSFLADAGHGVVLSPGDALVLPNHGLERTAMHSVFCADAGTAYGLSVALRAVPPGAPPVTLSG